MAIPSMQQWMADTNAGFGKPRSSTLKILDSAIQKYETARTQPNLFAIKNAFEDWKRSKGMGDAWKSSVRNRSRAVTVLDTELSKVADYGAHRAKTFTPEEQAALRFVVAERRKVIAKIFEGKKVRYRNSPKAIKEAVKTQAETVKKECAKAKAFLDGSGKKSVMSPSDLARRKLEEMVKSMFSVGSLDQLGSLSGDILGILGQCSVSISPVVGYVKDGYDLFTGWAKVAESLHKQYSISSCEYVIDTGVPAAAFQGVKSCLKTQTKKEVGSATAATTSFALKTGLAFVDGGAISGPVVGAANAVANLSLQIYWMATEYKATKAINEALAAGNLDVKLFETYPLMGCYLMTSATLSDLIPIDCFGTPGWMDYIETMKKRNFDGIYDAAADLIKESPWEIEGLPKRRQGRAGLQLGAMTGAASDVKGLFL